MGVVDDRSAPAGDRALGEVEPGHHRVAVAAPAGTDGQGALVIALARLVADRARDEAELELMAEPELSIVCFRYRPAGWEDAARLDRLNSEILDELRRQGRSLPSRTNIDGAFALRACYINPRTERSDVNQLVDDVLTIGREISAQ